MRLLQLCAAMTAGLLLVASDVEAAKRRPKHCAPKSPSTEQRVCPNADSYNKNLPPAHCKNCNTDCSIMGDPHIAPWWSKCTTVVGLDVGNYLLYYVPAKGQNMKQATNFTVTVAADAGKNWVKKLYLNGKEIMDADTECWTGDDKKKSGKIALFSDGTANKKGAKANVFLDYEVFCRDRQSSKNAKQLIVNLGLKDSFDRAVSEPPTHMPPKTTFFFANDKGMCNDPVVYGQGIPPEEATNKDYELVCSRQSDFKGFSGRYCKCTASCAAWGDPHLMDFYTKQCRKSKGCNFLAPLTKQPQYQMLYHANQAFGVRKFTENQCGMIASVEVYGLDKRIQQKFYGCTEEAGNLTRGQLDWAQEFSDKNWDSVRLDASKVCKKMGQRWTIPSDDKNTGITALNNFNKKYYDESVRGYNLGNQILVRGDDGRQYLVPVNDHVGYSRCLEKKGFDPAMATNMVGFGGASATLTCHRTKGNKWYFNVCVNKKDMTVEKFYKNGKQFQHFDQYPTHVPDWGPGMMQTLEEAGFTGGFCATGNFKQGSGVSTAVQDATFWYRPAGEVRKFLPVEPSPA